MHYRSQPPQISLRRRAANDPTPPRPPDDRGHACAFYALFVVVGVVMGINFMLELLHKLLGRITGGER
jgi:hypothetical protein